MINTNQKKYIFISDIHLGNQNSFQPAQADSFPYGWTNTHTSDLASFLSELDDHPETRDADGVMIVGDLLDTWVCPSRLAPPNFKRVLSAKHNAEVIIALNRVAEKRPLMYIPGNHDMLVQNDTLKHFIRNIRIVGTSTDHTAFYGGRLVAEHGHEYCLFNAVDSWSRPRVDGHLPLGLFMARMAAEGAFEKNNKTNYLDILAEFITHFSPSAHFAGQVMDAVLKYERDDVKATHIDPFFMNYVDHFKAQISYSEVIDFFGNIYDQWDNHSKSGVPATMAVLGDAGSLRPAADLKYLGQGRMGGPVKIAIFGHTHKYEIKTGLMADDETGQPTDTQPKRADVIYGNCGTWIDRKPCTFIVAEKSMENGKMRIDIRGYEYVLGEGGGRISQLDAAYVLCDPS